MSETTSFGVGIEEKNSSLVVSYEFETAADMLTRRTSQLTALLSATYGEAGDGFRTLSNSLQEDFMWLAHDLAQEISLLSRVVTHPPRS